MKNLKSQIKQSGVSGKLALAAAVLGVVSLVAFLIYGAVYSMYADIGVALFLLLGAACQIGYALWQHPASELLPLVGMICNCVGMILFFLNSYTVWADWYGNFNMYGSQGGVAPVIAILVLTLLTILLGLAACFTRKGAKEGK